MYINGPFKKYIDDLAGNLPAPGGGSAASAAGALGVAALSMVANFTIGKAKYQDVEEEMCEILKKTERTRMKLEHLIDEDVNAYKTVTTAYQMPKATDEQKKTRSEAIQASLKEAMKAPYESACLLHETMLLCEPLAKKGNTNLLSDVGVGSELIAGAFASSVLNVQINLNGLKEPELVSKIETELSEKEKVIKSIRKKISKIMKGNN